METPVLLLHSNFRKATLLVVEDNDDAWTLTRIAIRRALPELTLFRANTCEQALTYVTNCIEQRLPLPKLILQDLYMPDREAGLNLLKAIRKKLAAGQWPQLPVIITSSSLNPNDIDACYRCGASSYVVKSTNLSEQFVVYQSLRKFWWETSVLPLTELHC